MGRRVLFPRMSKTDCEGLTRAHRNCLAMHGMLLRTQWSGAAACIEMVGQIDLVIAALYNKAERAFAPAEAAAPASSPGDAPAEIPAPEAEAPYGAMDPERKEGD